MLPSLLKGYELLFYLIKHREIFLLDKKQQLLFDMWISIIPLALAFVGHVAGQTVYLAGDSTMAPDGGGKGTEGKLLPSPPLPHFSHPSLIIFKTNPSSFLRLGSIPPLLSQNPRHQQSLCRPLCPQFHPRKSFRRNRESTQEGRFCHH